MPNLSLPGNPRYQPKELQEFFGYDNLYRGLAEVELAVLDVLANHQGVIPRRDYQQLTPELREKILAITTTEVDKVEREITKHDVRAWVRLAQEILPPCLRRWIHVPLTSYDALDTGRILQFARAHQAVVRPLTDKLILILAAKARELAEVKQIGRTHGQHALPITAGFWLATILSRLVFNLREANRFASGLVGKISGAVGAYNAQIGLEIDKPEHENYFEYAVLKKLGLAAAPISTQILPPEPLAYYLYACLMISATLGQLGRDGRQLMRTEIAEIGEPFETGQVGSSTMAHKRNPINFENLEGTWLKNLAEFLKVLLTLSSEHQRDLVGSSVARDFPTIIVNLVQQLNTLLRPGKNDPRSFLERLTVDPEACQRNLALSGDQFLAEPLYLALQMAGYEGDAHRLVNEQAMPQVKAGKMSLVEAVEWAAGRDEAAARAWGNIPPEISRLFYHPENYTGLAAEKTRQICSLAETFVQTSPPTRLPG